MTIISLFSVVEPSFVMLSYREVRVGADDEWDGRDLLVVCRVEGRHDLIDHPSNCVCHVVGQVGATCIFFLFLTLINEVFCHLHV